MGINVSETGTKFSSHAHNPGRSRLDHYLFPTYFPQNIPGRSEIHTDNSSKTVFQIYSNDSGILQVVCACTQLFSFPLSRIC